MTRAEALRGPIGLARRTYSLPFDSDGQRTSAGFYDKDGLLDYFSPTEYWKLSDFTKKLFMLDYTPLDKELAAQDNRESTCTAKAQSLYMDFLPYFWNNTVSDLTVGRLNSDMPAVRPLAPSISAHY